MHGLYPQLKLIQSEQKKLKKTQCSLCAVFIRDPVAVIDKMLLVYVVSILKLNVSGTSDIIQQRKNALE